MSEYAMLTAVGPDRPGLVHAVSNYILASGCNIEDSRMAVLGGEFAMLILVAGTAPQIDQLLAGVGQASGASGLSVQARRTRPPSETAQAGTIPYTVEAYSMDHPGIVQSLTSFLAARKINIRALDTRVTYAPVTGQPLFSLHATIDMPPRENVMDVRRELERIGAEQNIDVELRPATRA
jgi:glycine cleavage system transcriptional repressor